MEFICEWKVKRKIVSSNCPLSQAKINEFHLKYCIPKGNTENKEVLHSHRFRRYRDPEDEHSLPTLTGVSMVGFRQIWSSNRKFLSFQKGPIDSRY